MKTSTRSFIGMLDTNWVTDLLNNKNWADIIFHVLTAFFMIYDANMKIDFSDKILLRKYLGEKLNKMQNDIGNSHYNYFVNVHS